MIDSKILNNLPFYYRFLQYSSEKILKEKEVISGCHYSPKLKVSILNYNTKEYSPIIKTLFNEI